MSVETRPPPTRVTILNLVGVGQTVLVYVSGGHFCDWGFINTNRKLYLTYGMVLCLVTFTDL